VNFIQSMYKFKYKSTKSYIDIDKKSILMKCCDHDDYENLIEYCRTYAASEDNTEYLKHPNSGYNTNEQE